MFTAKSPLAISTFSNNINRKNFANLMLVQVYRRTKLVKIDQLYECIGIPIDWVLRLKFKVFFVVFCSLRLIAHMNRMKLMTTVE